MLLNNLFCIFSFMGVISVHMLEARSSCCSCDFLHPCTAQLATPVHTGASTAGNYLVKKGILTNAAGSPVLCYQL